MILKKILANAWTKIELAYKAGEICSERHLQSELYRIIKDDLLNSDFDVYVEPKILCRSLSLPNVCINGLIPDILITKKNELIAIVEIKYVPHGFVSYQKDMGTFNKFAFLCNKDANLFLKTDPLNGDWNYNESISISPFLTFVYLTISKYDAYVVTGISDIWADLTKEKFQCLHFYGAINGESNTNFDYFSNDGG